MISVIRTKVCGFQQNYNFIDTSQQWHYNRINSSTKSMRTIMSNVPEPSEESIHGGGVPVGALQNTIFLGSDDGASTGEPNLNNTLRRLRFDSNIDDLSQESFPEQLTSADEEKYLLSPRSQIAQDVSKPQSGSSQTASGKSCNFFVISNKTVGSPRITVQLQLHDTIVSGAAVSSISYYFIEF